MSLQTSALGVLVRLNEFLMIRWYVTVCVEVLNLYYHEEVIDREISELDTFVGRIASRTYYRKRSHGWEPHRQPFQGRSLERRCATGREESLW